MDSNKNDIIDEITIITTGCQKIANSVSEAYTMVDEGEHIVKIPGQRLSTLTINHADGTTGVLVDIVNNFRNSSGKPLGHLDTKKGPMVIPRWWPTHPYITQELGIPHRHGLSDLIVDAFVLSSYWGTKVRDNVLEPPSFAE